MSREPDLDFLYYSNDLIGAGGLLYLMEQGIKIPEDMGLAGFNGVSLLKGLPKQLASMDAMRIETGRKAAEIIAARVNGEASGPERVSMNPTISYGDTLRRP